MKVFFPRNISGSWLSMSVQVGPVQISIVQLMLLAIGIGLALSIWNVLANNGLSKGIALFLALPIFLFFVLVAFFKFSELRIHEFIAKLIQTNFLDATKKYQLNRKKPDPVAIALARSRKIDHGVVIEQKQFVVDKEKLERLNVLSTKRG